MYIIQKAVYIIFHCSLVNKSTKVLVGKINVLQLQNSKKQKSKPPNQKWLKYSFFFVLQC